MYRRVLSRSNSNLVRVAQVNQVATVTIDNSPVNLLSRAVLTDIASTFDNLGNDESVKAVIMKSGAKGVYTAGLDIMEIYNRKDDEIFEYWSLLQNMWLSLYTAKTPVIAQINGTCPAAGCLMAIAADYRIMENNKKYKIGLNETQLGFAAPDWLCFNYRDIIGSRLAELHLQLGTLFDPNEALSIGLVDQVCAPEEIDIAAEKMANGIVHIPYKAIRLTKQLMREDLANYLRENQKEDAYKFISQVQAEETQMNIGRFLAAMKK